MAESTIWWLLAGSAVAIELVTGTFYLLMLAFAGGQQPALRLLVVHDDANREFAYTAGAEQVLRTAQTFGWTAISMKSAWRTIFPAS